MYIQITIRRVTTYIHVRDLYTCRCLKSRYMYMYTNVSAARNDQVKSLFKYKYNSREHCTTLPCIRALQILCNESNALAKLFYKLALPSCVTVISVRVKTNRVFVSQEYRKNNERIKESQVKCSSK